MLGGFHQEFARKLTRRPEPGERTYVTVFGPTGTGLIAVGAAVASCGVVLAAVQPWRAASAGVQVTGWAVAVPLALVAWQAWRFWGRRALRWSPAAAVLFTIANFAAYTAASLGRAA
jgi:hypothetical protein